MAQAIIIDDEERCRDTLATVLSEFPDIEVVAQCNSADMGVQAIYRHRPDLVFLDVEMPYKTGLEMLADLDEITFDVIFTTAYDKYSLQAIKASALDYLLKPVSTKDLAGAIERFRKKKKVEDIASQVQILIQHQKHNSKEHKIALSTVSGLEFVPVGKIIRLQSEINYTVFHLADGKKLTVAKTLKEFEELLVPYGMVRVYKSHIVNPTFVKKYLKGDGGTLILEDGSEIPVSSQRKEELLNKLKGF
jgi:two-component system, LytTR family, response regulator